MVTFGLKSVVTAVRLTRVNADSFLRIALPAKTLTAFVRGLGRDQSLAQAFKVFPTQSLER